MNLVIPKELLEKIVTVLSEMPYRSVFGLIDEIKNSVRPLEEKAEEEKADA